MFAHCVCQVTIDLVEESEVNFVELVHSLLEDPSERKHFFQVRQHCVFVDLFIYPSIHLSIQTNKTAAFVISV